MFARLNTNNLLFVVPVQAIQTLLTMVITFHSLAIEIWISLFYRILFPDGLNTALLPYLLLSLCMCIQIDVICLFRLRSQEGPLALEDALELSASCKNQQCRGSYVLQIHVGFTNIEEKMNLIPQINVLKLDEILPNRSSTTSNPAAEGTFDFLAI